MNGGRNPHHSPAALAPLRRRLVIAASGAALARARRWKIRFSRAVEVMPQTRTSDAPTIAASGAASASFNRLVKPARPCKPWHSL
jgi:hypothetical protein